MAVWAPSLFYLCPFGYFYVLYFSRLLRVSARIYNRLGTGTQLALKKTAQPYGAGILSTDKIFSLYYIGYYCEAIQVDKNAAWLQQGQTTSTCGEGESVQIAERKYLQKNYWQCA